jgi:hypothetical protein
VSRDATPSGLEKSAGGPAQPSHGPCRMEFRNTRAYARESNVSREMVANCSRPVRLLQLMLMPVQIATRAILTPSPNLSIA